MIKLFYEDIRDDGFSSSKGNQLKWKKDNIWYKKDNMGYEGLAEFVISHLLLLSNLDKESFVLYDTEQIEFNGNVFLGCKSKNFLKEGEELVTLERLYQNQYGRSLYIDIFKITGPIERLKYLLEFVKRYIDKKEFAKFLHILFIIDMFFKNEDRHMNNIGLIRKVDGSFRICPIFDNGAALGSDITLFHNINEDPIETYDNIKSKTISFDFETQEEVISEITKSAGDLVFDFNISTLVKILDDEPYYDEIIKNRVFLMIKKSMDRYRYLFKEDPFDSYYDSYKKER